MKNKPITASAIALALLATTACSEKVDDTATQETPGAEQASENTNTPDTADAAKVSELLEEAVSALEETQGAIAAIDKGDNQEAVDALARATGKLEIILAREPDLALAPVGTSVTEHDILASASDVKKLRDRIEGLIDDGRLQDARRLMDELASEMVVSTSNLPLATYPAAIKRAATLLDEQKPQEAKLVLLNALSTVVVTETIIPLPIVRAQIEVEAARVLAKDPNRSEEDNKAIAAALQDAREQVELAQALGYATKKGLDDLLDSIKEIEREIRGGNAAERFFDKIEGLFDKARSSVQSTAKKS